jgi:hypothetical protein
MSRKIPRIKVLCPICDHSFLTTARRIDNNRGRFCSVSCASKFNSTKHGHTSKTSSSRTYNSWVNMLRRCLKTTHHKYSKYGAVGITVCDEWKDFKNFLRDMGERPPGTTIDRWPNQLGSYKLGNCRWATPREQQANLKSNIFIEFRGERIILAHLAERFKIDANTLRYRIARGWSDDQLVSEPQIGNRSRGPTKPPAVI